MTPKDVFEDKLAKRITDKPDMVKSINASYKFDITGDEGGTWIVDLKTEGGEIRQADEEADCTITMTDTDFVLSA